ncbi:hypothetical protein BpHYR1_042671 [Brachionus plicatilis]|uniref:Uncharacterized protein n=1 Tax=Brachionus plicatilis TaxID=10195 RepID=A0A3M7R2W5_BRAPC|nr:hypothetical protein BpHYR1_042671 [Brachionus plicatilis]
MTRLMYQVPKPHKNASKKVIDTPIEKPGGDHHLEKEWYCPKKLALDYMVGLSTIYDIIANFVPIRLYKNFNYMLTAPNF